MSGARRLLLVLHRAGRAGTEYHALWLSQGLRAHGWDVDLAVSEQGPLLERFAAAGVRVHRIPRHGGADGVYVTRLARLARSLRARVLHAHSGRLAAFAGRMAGVPAVVETRHGLGPIGEPPPHARLRREACLCRWSHVTLTVCASDRARLIEGGLAPQRVVCVPNGIPETSIPVATPPEGVTRLGFLGRLSEQKDPLFLTELADALDRRIPGGWTLAVAGEGPLRALLERRLAGRAVSWLGETDGPEPLLAACEFLLSPSRWEGQPLAVLAAMDAGIVTVAHRLACLEELLGGNEPAGVLLPRDAAAWADAIVALRREPGRRARIADAGRRRVASHHRLGPMVAGIEAVYLERLARARGG